MSDFNIPLEDKLDLRTEKVMISVRMARIMHEFKDNHLHSSIAEEFISDMSKYEQYCKKEKKEDWTKCIRVITYGTGSQVVDDYDIKCHLQAFEVAGLMMEEYNKGTSWEDLKEYLSWCEVVDEEVAFKLFEFAKDGEQIAINLFGENFVKTFKSNRVKPSAEKQD